MDTIAHLSDSLYALTLGKKRVVAFFSAITLTQLIMGMYTVGVAARKPGMRWIVGLLKVMMFCRLAREMPPIPLPAYHLCIFTRSPRFEIPYMALSLFFGNWSPAFSGISLSDQPPFLDVMAFSVVVFISFGAGLALPGGRSGILRTIVEDATVYFLVIFSSHLLTLVVGSAARVSSNVLVDIWMIGNQFA